MRVLGTDCDLRQGSDNVLDVTVRNAGSRQVERARVQLLDLGAPPMLPFDLRVDLLLPTRTVLDGHTAATPGLRIASLGPERSPAKGVTVLRRDADLADSRETSVGTPNTFAPLLALQPKEMALLHLTDMSPPETGSVSYRIHFANPVSDADASNGSPAPHLRYRLTTETMDSAGAAPRSR